MLDDALALASAIRNRKMSALEAMEASIVAVRDYSHLGAVVRMDADRGRTQAMRLDRGPGGGAFGGVPFLVKDLGGPFEGWPVSAGSRALQGAPEASVEAADGNFAHRLRATGLCIFGMTSVPEFGLSLATDPTLGAPCMNPLAPHLTAGGSSGGAAAAVAQGIVPIAHATDAGGSIRVPAACCGLVGLKPSRGAVASGPGVENHLCGLATELVVCRSIRDAEAAFESVRTNLGRHERAALGSQVAPDQVRIGLLTDTGDETPTCYNYLVAAQDAARALEHNGHSVADVSWAQLGPLARASGDVFASIVCVNLAELFSSGALDASKTEPITQVAIEAGLAMSGTDLLASQNSIVHTAHRLCHMFETMDCIVAPMLAKPPPPIGSFPMDSRDINAHFSAMAAFSPTACLANVSGFSALTLPFGEDADGLPLPVQLIAPVGGEGLLFALAKRLESEGRWHHRFAVRALAA